MSKAEMDLKKNFRGEREQTDRWARSKYEKDGLEGRSSWSSGEDPVGHSSSEGNSTQMFESGQKQKAGR